MPVNPFSEKFFLYVHVKKSSKPAERLDFEDLRDCAQGE